MRYQKCKYLKGNHCYNIGLRNGQNSLDCAGYDRCNYYDIKKTSRVDTIGQNGNNGDHYDYVYGTSYEVMCSEMHSGNQNYIDKLDELRGIPNGTI